MSRRPRVLVVDDSAFARTVLSRVLRTSDAIDVVGTARDGDDALERIATLEPDLVTLDLTMPNRDGLEVLRALAGRPWPKVIVVSISGIDTELGAEALVLGAIDLVSKPSALADERLQSIGEELIAKLVAAGCRPDPDAVPVTLPPAPPIRLAGRAELVLIGCSTGGPQALTRIVSSLPATLAAPVVIALHIPPGYTEALAKRLDKASPLNIVEAHDGLVLAPGMIALAQGGAHLRVVRRGAALVAEVSALPIRPFAPSVDELLGSGARAVGARALGVVLTGMGNDGLEGARAIHDARGTLITEAPSTCVVYGMPRAIQEAGLGATSLPLDLIAAEIARRV